jgi:hypothetical protein
MLNCIDDLVALSHFAAGIGMPVTPLRTYEILLWTQLERSGYYR